MVNADAVVRGEAALLSRRVEVAKQPFAGVGMAAGAAQVQRRPLWRAQEIPAVIFGRLWQDEAEPPVVVFIQLLQRGLSALHEAQVLHDCGSPKRGAIVGTNAAARKPASSARMRFSTVQGIDPCLGIR